MPDMTPIPSWHQPTPRLTPELESAHLDFDEQGYSGGSLDSLSSLASLENAVSEPWTEWPRLFDMWEGNPSHTLDARSPQIQGVSSPRQLGNRLPTPEYRESGSYVSFSPTSPTQIKLECEQPWLTSPPQQIPTQPLINSCSALRPDQLHYSQQCYPFEGDDASSEETAHSPRQHHRYSPSVLTELPGQAEGYLTSPLDHVFDHDTRDWLSFVSPESNVYEDSSPIVGRLPTDSLPKSSAFLGYQSPNDYILTAEPSCLQSLDISPPNSLSNNRPISEHRGPCHRTAKSSSRRHNSSRVNPVSRVTSRKSSISSGGTTNETAEAASVFSSSASSSRTSPLSSRYGGSPVDEAPLKQALLRRNTAAITATGTTTATATTRRRKERGIVTKVEKSTKPFLSLQIVQEDGLGGSISHSARIPTAARARRNGPLTMDGRRDAALRRKDRSVCVWCRLAKKKCSGETPCTTCIEQSKSMIFEQPCVKADFFQIVESGTCNYISQRAVNHMTLDGSTRVRMELPSSFEMANLLSMLDERRGKFNIRARQSWGTLYTLDLNETYRFLEELSRGDNSSQYDLSDFIDHRILKSNKWVKCVKETDPTEDTFTLLSQWNNMPSRASYDFVPLDDDDDTAPEPMDVRKPEHRREILLAAQLSRIFCRKLEVDGYRALQNALNKNKWDEAPLDVFLKFVSQLGQILLTLRWRVSWWELLGDGGRKPDAAKERYEERVKSLCKILYFYYTSVKLKLPAWSAPTDLDGVWSNYADAASVWDDFPCTATMEGYDSWMARGRELIHEAGVKSRIAKF